ncbi:MAG TPA: hypothetical protein VG722_02985, partial [Tepidisphaeraceae bacterium]|nr:hypothetical protein [Tepidisphaeraceae bacterium]
TEKDPATKRKFKDLIALYSVNTLTHMLSEPYGKEFVQSAIYGSEHYFHAVGIQHEIGNLLLETDPKELENPQTLWTVVDKNAQRLQSLTQEQIRNLPKEYGWPQDIITAIALEQVATVRNVVYQNYDAKHIPPKLAALRSEFRAVNRCIDALNATR